MTFTSRQLVPMALAIAGTYYVTRALLQRRAEQRDTRDDLMGRVDDARTRARTTPHVPVRRDDWIAGRTRAH